MIDRTLLDDVTAVVTHANCPDGIASAILLGDVLEGVPISFMQYNTEAHDKLEAKPGMLFCDFTPPHARLQEFVDAGAIVLDHHAKQRADVEAFGARGVYADLETEPGVSGAMLALREVWAWRASQSSPMYQRAHEFARLAGVRDTWQTSSPDWKRACEQAEALRFYPWSFFAKLDEPFDQGREKLRALLEIGPVLIERALETTARVIEGAYGTKTARGTKLMIVSTLHTSDVAEAIGDQADLVIGFSYQGGAKTSLILSMRARGDYDAGAFSKSLGGGGHRAAAGATVPVLSGSLNPYQAIVKLVDEWEHGL